MKEALEKYSTVLTRWRRGEWTAGQVYEALVLTTSHWRLKCKTRTICGAIVQPLTCTTWYWSKQLVPQISSSAMWRSVYSEPESTYRGKESTYRSTICSVWWIAPHHRRPKQTLRRARTETWFRHRCWGMDLHTSDSERSSDTVSSPRAPSDSERVISLHGTSSINVHAYSKNECQKR